MPEGIEAQASERPSGTDRAAYLRNALARFEAPLVRFARRLVGNAETARDIAQDCFLRLCQQRELPPEARVAPWLFRVCRNRSIDHLRKNGRMPNVNGTPILELAPAKEAASTHRAVERGDEADHLRTLLGELTARQQELVRLKFQDALSYREIAELTGLSVSNVGFILHTALKTLRARATRRQIQPAERSSR